MTDNAKAYLCERFQNAITEDGARHWSIPAHSPQINGKVERLNRTFLDEWAYVKPWPNNKTRTNALDDWLHPYNHHRHHTVIDGPPISRANDLPGHMARTLHRLRRCSPTGRPRSSCRHPSGDR